MYGSGCGKARMRPALGWTLKLDIIAQGHGLLPEGYVRRLRVSNEADLTYVLEYQRDCF